MNTNDIENHMVLGNPDDATLSNEQEVAQDAQLKEELEAISQAGELTEYFSILDCTRLDFYEHVRDELVQLDVDAIASIAECKINDNDALNLMCIGNIHGAAVERVKEFLKSKAEK